MTMVMMTKEMDIFLADSKSLKVKVCFLQGGVFGFILRKLKERNKEGEYFPEFLLKETWFALPKQIFHSFSV